MVKGLGSVLAEKNHPVVWIVNGASFIGSYLAERLLSKRCIVVVIDNWSKGVQENLNHLKDEKNFQTHSFDITANLSAQIESAEVSPPNYIFYLERTRDDTPETVVSVLKELSIGIEQLLEIAVINRAKFLFAYTAHKNENSHASAVGFAKTLISEFVKSKNLDARLVLIGDPYGPRMLLTPYDPIALVLRRVLYNMSPSGLWPSGQAHMASVPRVTPVFVTDVANGLLLAMFGANTKGKNFSFGVREITVGEFNNEVLNLARFVSTRIVNDLPRDLLSLHIQGSILPAQTHLDVGIEKTLRFFRENLTRFKAPVEPFFKKEVKTARRRIKIPKGPRRFITLVLSLLVFWFFVLPPLTLAAGFSALAITKDKLINGDFDNAQITSGLARSLLGFSRDRFGSLEVLPGVGELAHNARVSASTGVLVSSIAVRAARIGEQGKELFNGVLNPNAKAKLEVSDRLAIDIETLARDLDFLKTEDSWNTFSAIGGPASDWDTKQLLPIAGLIRQSEDLLGYKSKKVYLILLQNNMELRATGGFIGSFGLLTLEHGKLINFEVQDVYSADGQLKGHVEPPDKLREHLGEAQWYLRDSNWDPDFPTSAQRAEWFLDKEVNIRVDGVLGIDLATVKELVGIVGSIKIPDFNVTVDKNNFYEKTQFYAENNFFPGSSQKKDFLTAVSKELVGRLRESGSNTIAITRVLSDSFSERHILVYLHNKQAQTTLSHLGWDGGLKNVKCPMSHPEGVSQSEYFQCQTDYLMVVDSNVGVNKANYGLSRSFLLNTQVEKDNLNHELAVSYLNKSNAQNVYKNYLRVYVPNNAALISASILNSATGEKKDLRIDNSQEHEKTIFGMLVEVPSGESRQVILRWQIPITADTKSLVFLWQKQPGIGEDPVNILFKSDNFKIRLTPSASLTQNGVVGYNTVFTSDLQVNAVW